MKQNLFLLASIFAVLHLCKAGPLRLHKRAAFYIANETACVVDNIVYSSGDPIPTDDPCEACKCRPPGFACVLKECRVKPGCRAVRHAGQCCPEYVCGCEHNGRMYQDGEEIRDAKNPCYICHCQGSSIACAFVDCFFRIDCPPVYTPGECCPEYTNCTRDLPETDSFNENNAVPSLNLLPGLNEESIFVPEKLPTTSQTFSSSEIPTDPPTQPPVVTDRSEGTYAPEIKISTDESSVFQTTQPTISVSEEHKPDPVTEEKNTVEATASSDINRDELPKDESNDKVVENEEIILLNSETEIKKDENAETTTVKIDQPNEEVIKEDPQIKPASEEEPIFETKVTEKQSEAESTSTEIPTTEKTVKNSAADNSKSLKLSDGENNTEKSLNKFEIEEVKTEVPVKAESKTNETVTQQPAELLIKLESDEKTESRSESEENIAEESQINPKSALYNNKIKSESAETVTIVVHVKEKAKPATETDSVSEHVTSESITHATQENLSEHVTSEPIPNATPEHLLKSNDALKSTDVNTELVKVETTTLVGTNFEAFPSSTEANKIDLSTVSPVTDEKSKDAKSISEETESTLDVTENPVKDDKTFDLKTEEESSEVATFAQNEHVTDSTPVEVRADEGTAETAKTDEPKVSVVKVEESNAAISDKTTTASETELKSDKATENESKYVETTEATKTEESVEEIGPEVRDDDADIKPEEKEEKTSTKRVQETTPEEKVESTSPQTEEIKPDVRVEEKESKEKLENVEKTKPEEIQEQSAEVTTEFKDQDIKESTQTVTPKNNID